MQRNSKLVTLGNLGMPGHTHLKWQYQFEETFDVYLQAKQLTSSFIFSLGYCKDIVNLLFWGKKRLSVITWTERTDRQTTRRSKKNICYQSWKCHPEHNAKIGPHGIEFWRSWNARIKYTNHGRAQRLDEKNGVIYLVIMFTSTDMVINMSKMAHFCIFRWLQQQKKTVLVKYLSASERSYWILSENDMVNRFWTYSLWDIENSNIKKLLSQQKILKPETLYFQGLTTC